MTFLRLEGASGELANIAGVRPHPSEPGHREPVVRVPARDTFAINGRFLTQSVTGVQRYARETTSAMATIMAEDRRTASILTPANAPDFTCPALQIKRVGGGSGHAWEQTALPLACDKPLLNLCNTAPVFADNRVLCIHDANVFTAPSSYTWRFRTAYKLLQPLLSRRSTFIATVSQTAARAIAAFLPVSPSRIVLMPNGHEHALRWDPARSILGRSWTGDRPFVLMIGSLAPHKNIGRVLGLAEALDAMNLDLAVAGAPAAIFGKSATVSADNIRWLGKVTDDDLAFLMQRALCLAFPSLSEGFGLPIVEAMAWDCPVVASKSSSVPEVCGDAALLVDAGDDRQWIRQFEKLVSSRNCREELRGRGREQITRFSWRTSAQSYLDLMSTG